MSGGNILKLTECKRSESSLFDIYTQVLGLPLKESLQLASQFQYAGPCRFYLVISHSKRVIINRRENEKEAKGKSTLYIAVPNTKAKRHYQQSMHIYVGMQLFGCTNRGERLGVRNGLLYTVEAIQGQSIVINSREFDIEQVKSFFRLSYARTYASCQGTEFNDEAICLCDTRHPRFTNTHLYVGLSRCKRADLIRVEA